MNLHKTLTLNIELGLMLYRKQENENCYKLLYLQLGANRSDKHHL